MSGDTLLLTGIAACAGVVAVLLFRASPKLAFAAWALVLFFVPVWIGANIGMFWSAITLVTLLALAATIKNMRFVLADGLMLLFLAFIVVLFGLKMATFGNTIVAVAEWGLSYLWGRIVLARLGKDFLVQVLALAATVAAVLALIEFATGKNFFVELPATSSTVFSEWGTLQFRAQQLRVEGAWGHSIAFGAALGMSSSFVIAVRWPVVLRLAALAVISAATVATFSRIGMGTLALTIVLAVILLPGLPRALRIGIVVIGALGAAAVIPFLGTVFTDAGGEASGSADYRGSLFTLLSEVQLIGSAGDWSGLTQGGEYLGGYARSVDNAFLLIALRFGWIPTLLLFGVLVAAALTIWGRRRATPPAISVLAQLPALFGVALITQFSMYLWFLAGLAVAWRQQEAEAVSPPVPKAIREHRPVARGRSRAIAG